VHADAQTHARAARALAADEFDARDVLGDLVSAAMG